LFFSEDVFCTVIIIKQSSYNKFSNVATNQFDAKISCNLTVHTKTIYSSLQKPFNVIRKPWKKKHGKHPEKRKGQLVFQKALVQVKSAPA